jgi:hypothetical protein
LLLELSGASPQMSAPSRSSLALMVAVFFGSVF